jgi:hypothetical protein
MADENIVDNGGSPGHTNKKTQLTVEERKQVVASLLIGSIWHNETLKLAPRAVLRVAKESTKHVSTIRHIWKRAQENFSKFGKLTASPKQSTGRPILYNPTDVAMAVEEVAYNSKRGSVCSLAASLAMSKGTLHRLKSGYGGWDEQCIIPHSSALKPLLAERRAHGGYSSL